MTDWVSVDNGEDGMWDPGVRNIDVPRGVFDGFPLDGLVGIDYEHHIPDTIWTLDPPSRIETERHEWFALVRRPSGLDERVRIPDAVITEMQRSDPNGAIFRIHPNEPDPGLRLQVQINAAAERVGGTGTSARWETHEFEFPHALFGDEVVDASRPDTSQPYFLDLIARIDDVTR